MRRWFTKEYWNQPELPWLGWFGLWVLLITSYLYFPKLLEYITRP